MHRFIDINITDLLSACDELVNASHSTSETNAINLAYEMILNDASHIGATMTVRTDELDGEYCVESRTVVGRFYDVTVDDCSCPAGQAHQICWHRKYVQLLEQFKPVIKRRKSTYEKAAIDRQIAELFPS